MFDSPQQASDVLVKLIGQEQGEKTVNVPLEHEFPATTRAARLDKAWNLRSLLRDPRLRDPRLRDPHKRDSRRAAAPTDVICHIPPGQLNRTGLFK
jgi:hypothetical protein